MVSRVIDTRFAKNTISSFDKRTEGIVSQYAKAGVYFKYCPEVSISATRNLVNDRLKYDIHQSLDEYNRPNLYIMPHCLNTIRAFDRHYWMEGKEKEAEKYKDPIDCCRNLLGYLGDSEWKTYARKTKKIQKYNTYESLANKYFKSMNDISMV